MASGSHKLGQPFARAGTSADDTRFSMQALHNANAVKSSTFSWNPSPPVTFRPTRGFVAIPRTNDRARCNVDRWQK
jgi:hypothetical protein